MVWNIFAIKVIDDAGHTVTVFERVPASEATQMELGGKVVDIPAVEERWMSVQKPDSRRSQRYIDADLTALGIHVPKQGPPRKVKFDKDANPIKVELPGLTLRWEKVTAVLDRLAENGITEITLAQLRKYA
ncbi:hypothetical protein BN1232_02246 [Mycobacterium lentiflavum]|uniref:Uncharacterized protein n=1 Tax=Mycobacterium lentiflavum TaxID=141349 RepID=A0A0E4GX49_MYCLN|nr:hypothetical protein [Mycobacterium lentiflavum]CQD11914.1 hypothetical protein BN1232_02246 [Mycobacterium lentiflavum]